MKKLFIFILVICLFVTSCNNNAKQQEIASQQAAKEAEKAKQDSLAKLQEAEKQARLAFEDSIAIYAWGDIKFGMNKKEVSKKKELKNAIKLKDHFFTQYKEMEVLKEALRLNNTPSLTVFFGGQNYNEVIRVNISGIALWDYFHELTEDINTLISQFKNKYGEPNYLYEFLSTLKYSDLDALNSGNAKRIAEWSIGSGNGENGVKTICISASKNSSTSYKYDCIITNSAFPKSLQERTQKEIDEEKEHAKRTKEAIDNAF